MLPLAAKLLETTVEWRIRRGVGGSPLGRVEGRVSIGSSGWVGAARNMKSMGPPLVSIFFMTYFYRAGGGDHGPLGIPPGSATARTPSVHFFIFTQVSAQIMPNNRLVALLPQKMVPSLGNPGSANAVEIP